jgi:spermidine synthase
MVKKLFVLSFIEGACVMALELIAAKLIAPYFGTSVVVWAAVLAMTLVALTIGYYLGGYFSSKDASVSTLVKITGLGAILLIIMPYIAGAVLPKMIYYNIVTGVILGLITFMVVPLILMGMVSPLIIHLIDKEIKTAGQSAGTIYAVSTLGGILATFSVGLYLMGSIGLKMSSLLFGILLIAGSFLVFFQKKRVGETLFLLLVACSLVSFTQKERLKTTNKYRELYVNNGILGEVKVMEIFYQAGVEGFKKARALVVNNTHQSMMSMEDPQVSYFHHVPLFGAIFSALKPKQKVLLLGLGGGDLYKLLIRKGLDVEVVEIDGRVVDLAKKYFYIPENINVHIDDARHFILTHDQKYDAIIFDTFLGETPPTHLITKESLQEVEKNLNPNGFVAINFYGFLQGEAGLGAKSILKTLKDHGFYVNAVTTPEPMEENRNMVMLGSRQKIDWSILTHFEPIFDTVKLSQRLVPNLNFDEGILLVDDKPNLDHLYLPAALKWRQSYIEYYKYLYK